MPVLLFVLAACQSSGSYPSATPEDVLEAGKRWDCAVAKACWAPDADIDECVDGDTRVPNAYSCWNPILAARCRDAFFDAADLALQEGCDAGYNADPQEMDGPCSVLLQENEPCGP
jgi:hypothetical protein